MSIQQMDNYTITPGSSLIPDNIMDSKKSGEYLVKNRGPHYSGDNCYVRVCVFRDELNDGPFSGVQRTQDLVLYNKVG